MYVVSGVIHSLVGACFKPKPTNCEGSEGEDDEGVADGDKPAVVEVSYSGEVEGRPRVFPAIKELVKHGMLRVALCIGEYTFTSAQWNFLLGLLTVRHFHLLSRHMLYYSSSFHP